jgi:enamine deaminase RidA (YjgF/YER057c/UK114 family)
MLFKKIHEAQSWITYELRTKWDSVNKIYTEFFGEHKPTRIVVPIGKLHFGCLVEIEAIAEVNK